VWSSFSVTIPLQFAPSVRRAWIAKPTPAAQRMVPATCVTMFVGKTEFAVADGNREENHGEHQHEKK
jgi:hypothetical protein